MANQVLLWIASAASTVYLRTTAFLFARMLPLGYYRFMPKILGAFAISLASFAFSRQLARSASNAENPLATALPILFGTYSRKNMWASLAGLLLNIRVLAFLACLDFIYRAHFLHLSESLAFSRTGYVAASTSAETQTIVLPVLTENSDYTATLELTGLVPGTRYFYNTTGSHAGSFTASKKFTMIITSCQKPFYPYSPLAHSLAIPGLHYLARYVESAPPEFVLFLGDFIYSDLPVQIEPLTTRFYRQLYRQIYASPSWTRTLRDLPWIHVFDDHELINDYFPSMPDGEIVYSRAMDPFEHYQRAANPPRANRDARKMYTQFRRGDASFFILDTRSYRAAPPAKADGGSGRRSMLGAEQLDELLWWIDTEDGWKVVVSSVPMTRNWSEGGDEMDSWAGYLDEREIIFQALWRVGGGVIVSVDRHEHATVKFPPLPTYPESHTIIEFSTSPLSFFYQPFLREYVSHEETVFNLPHGSSKFVQLTFDSANERKWTVGFHLVVDGEIVWEYEYVWTRDRACLDEGP